MTRGLARACALPRPPSTMLRDELLNLESFDSLFEAQVLIEDWRQEYNHYRPHQSLRYLTPAEFTRRWHAEHQPTPHSGWTDEWGLVRQAVPAQSLAEPFCLCHRLRRGQTMRGTRPHWRNGPRRSSTRQRPGLWDLPPEERDPGAF